MYRYRRRLFYFCRLERPVLILHKKLKFNAINQSTAEGHVLPYRMNYEIVLRVFLHYCVRRKPTSRFNAEYEEKAIKTTCHRGVIARHTRDHFTQLSDSIETLTPPPFPPLSHTHGFRLVCNLVWDLFASCLLLCRGILNIAEGPAVGRVFGFIPYPTFSAADPYPACKHV